MESAIPKRTIGLTVVAVLALVQSALGGLRALRWFDAGSDLMGQGLLILPLVGVLAFFRGGLVAAITMLYVVFACGALLGRSWARWLGIVVAAVTLFLARERRDPRRIAGASAGLVDRPGGDAVLLAVVAGTRRPQGGL